LQIQLDFDLYADESLGGFRLALASAFTPFFEIGLPKRGGVRGRKGEPLQTDHCRSKRPRASNWAITS
jgi:hypothetical protein